MKNTLLLVALLVIAWVWLPTSPSDIVVIPWLIHTFGMTVYVLISVALVLVIYKSIEGKGIRGKFKSVHNEIRRIL